MNIVGELVMALFTPVGYWEWDTGQAHGSQSPNTSFCATPP